MICSEFKCQWADTRDVRGCKKDDLGRTMVNFSRLIHTGNGQDDEPYVLALQARLVYYVEDPKEKGWCVVVHVKPRDLYDMGDPIASEEDDIMIEELPVQTVLCDNVPNIRLRKFWFDDPRKRRKYVISAVGCRCRDSKQHLWKAYRKNTLQEAFDARPGLVPEDQWKEFVEIQFTDKAKVLHMTMRTITMRTNMVKRSQSKGGTSNGPNLGTGRGKESEMYLCDSTLWKLTCSV
ncbi:unnamed protein product [Microthlaspi erraticum]|uniref:DUF4216 domain-containing protein n=1 Tax=Microthlaspi erraticum TaxID=1685480 RepID=A0A6D2JBH3_9BRAS|nr:unnamed protein product [Microthlaspi erraticum]